MGLGPAGRGVNIAYAILSKLVDYTYGEPEITFYLIIIKCFLSFLIFKNRC